MHASETKQQLLIESCNTLNLFGVLVQHVVQPVLICKPSDELPLPHPAPLIRTDLRRSHVHLKPARTLIEREKQRVRKAFEQARIRIQAGLSRLFLPWLWSKH